MWRVEPVGAGSCCSVLRGRPKVGGQGRAEPLRGDEPVRDVCDVPGPPAEEAAEVLRVSRSTIYDLMRSERLQSVKIGGSRRVPVAAVTLFVEALCGEDVA